MRAPVGDAGLLPAHGQAHRQKDMACSGATECSLLLAE